MHTATISYSRGILYLNIIEASVLRDELQKWLQTLQGCGGAASLQYESALGHEHAALAAINNCMISRFHQSERIFSDIPRDESSRTTLKFILVLHTQAQNNDSMILYFL